MLPEGYLWHPLDHPATPGWWQLRQGLTVVAQVQPFEGRAQVNVYPSGQPWKAKIGRAASVEQGKRHAERWLLGRLKALQNAP